MKKNERKRDEKRRADFIERMNKEFCNPDSSALFCNQGKGGI